jgi:hypothetical protein
MRRRVEHEERSQSAMEYLITYGWAILIVVIVFVALFQMGVLGNVSGPFVCLGNPGFVCKSEVLTSSGAVIATFGYIGATPITVTGLGCDITAPLKGPSYESQHIELKSGQTYQFVFQCPLQQSNLGYSIPVYLWIYYDQGPNKGLEQSYARGILQVNYISLLWNVVEWTPSSSNVNLLPFVSVAANPESPLNTDVVSTGSWSSLLYGSGGRSIGWSYSTDWHKSDVYNGIQTIPFPISPLNQDSVPCTGPPYAAQGYTATTHVHLSGTYSFVTWTDDGTEIFYKNDQGGAWTSVFSGNAWASQPPTFYAKQVAFPEGDYKLVVDFIDTCDPASVSMILITPPPQPA